jgi:hypothetical protein
MPTFFFCGIAEDQTAWTRIRRRSPGKRAAGSHDSDPRTARAHPLGLAIRSRAPHCERAIAFLDRLSVANPEIRVHKLEVSRDRANAVLMIETAERLGVEAGSVPLTVIGNRAWVGYLDDAGTGRELAAHIDGSRRSSRCRTSRAGNTLRIGCFTWRCSCSTTSWCSSPR